MKKNGLKNKSAALALILSVLTVAIQLSILGFFWEDTMTMHAALVYGTISEPPSTVWFLEILFLQFPILSFFSNSFVTLPVVGIWAVTILISIYWVWYLIAFRLAKRLTKRNSLFVYLTVTIAAYCLVSFALGYVHYTRLSILFVSGVLLLHFDLHKEQKSTIKWLYALFVVALFQRVSSGILVLILFTVLCYLNCRSIKDTFRSLWFQWYVSVFCVLTIIGFKYGTNNPALQIEQTYEYAISHRNRILPITQMQGKQDSIRYIALTEYFLIADSAQQNLSFVKKVIPIQLLLHWQPNREDLHHLQQIIVPLVSKYFWIIIILYLMLSIMMCTTNLRVWTNVCLFHLIGWCIVIILTTKISMEEHFLLPWLVAMFGASFWLLLDKPINVLLFQKTLIIIGLLFFSWQVLCVLKSIKKIELDYNEKAAVYLSNLSFISQSRTPVIWDYNYLAFPSNIMERENLEVFKKTIFQTDVFTLYYGFGQQRCFKQSGCSPLNWRCMNEAFNGNKNKYCFVMEERMAVFLKEYFQTLYDLPFNLVKDNPPVEVTPNNFVFHLQ